MTRIDRRPSLPAWRRGAVLVTVLLLVACTPPPIQRPREGAAPVAGGTAVRLENIPPPTLSPATPIPTATPMVVPSSPSPAPNVAVSPASSPGLAPIISSLQPAPGSSLPAGDVVISARISGMADLIDVTAVVDGEAVPLDLGAGTVRVKTISFVRTFISGTHEVRIQARDERGQIGGYRWQFSVGAGRLPTPAPQIGATARPATATPAVPAIPSRTPIPIPTRRPTVATAAPTTAPAAAAPARRSGAVRSVPPLRPDSRPDRTSDGACRA